MSISACVRPSDAWAWGFSGVMVRGRARPGTFRKAQPYECYSELDFDTPGRAGHGDCYDRYCHPHGGDAAVRRPSCGSASRGCANRTAKGPVVVGERKIVPPRRAEMKRSMEALIHHFKLYTQGYRGLAGKYMPLSRPPKGEFGVYLVADGSQQAVSGANPRARLRPSAGDGLACASWPSARRRVRGPRVDPSCSGRSTGERTCGTECDE